MEDPKGFWDILVGTLEQALNAALDQYGPGHVLAILGFFLVMWRHEWLWKARLKDKDREIHRIGKERDKYQDFFLQGARKSSELTDEGERKSLD